MSFIRHLLYPLLNAQAKDLWIFVVSSVQKVDVHAYNIWFYRSFPRSSGGITTPFRYLKDIQ